MATNGIEQATPAVPPSDAAAAPPTANLSKEEVGWYFVEQYYTTLSKSTEKLHLFYGKRSQFVYGQEAELADVSVGRQVIQQRIKNLGFQDLKVRVSNVDTQASFDNIVIQVIGEISNKSAEPRKFVQTFVLAQQPSGYFVLNDILRYISEDPEEVQHGQQQSEVQEQKQEEQTNEQEQSKEQEQEQEQEQAVELAAEEAPASATIVEAEIKAVEPEIVQVETVEVEIKAAEPEPVQVETVEAAEPAKPEAEESVSVNVEAAAEETAKETPKIEEPVPAPLDAPAFAPVVAAPAEPAAPPKPMTWASRAAAAAGPRPVLPLAKTAAPPAAAQARAPAPAAAPVAIPAAAQQQANAPVAAAPAAAVAPAVGETPAREASGWQTAGADSRRQNRPQAASTNAPEKEGHTGYVKYVTDKVQDADLRSALAVHGELVYFDINRAKNCAFVEYKTAEALQAALAIKEYVVNGENIAIEPRRPKTTSYGGNYAAGRVGSSGRSRGGFEGNRNGGQGAPRGNYQGQNRGRGGAPRARGGAQAAASS